MGVIIMIPVPVCPLCKHYKDGTRSCRAFDKIPDEIWMGENDHTKKHPKQKNNILFEKVNDKQP